MTVPWVTAQRWEVTVEAFAVEADLSNVLARNGPGVYTLLVWALDGDDYLQIAEHSIFFRVTPPEDYGDAL